MQTIEEFKKRLNAGDFKDAGGARKSLGKSGPKDEAGRATALSLINKHFGTTDAVAPSAGAKKSKAAPSTAIVPATAAAVTRVPKPKKGASAAAPARRGRPRAEPADREDPSELGESGVATVPLHVQLEAYSRHAQTLAVITSALSSCRGFVSDDVLRAAATPHIEAVAQSIPQVQRQVAQELQTSVEGRGNVVDLRAPAAPPALPGAFMPVGAAQ